MPVNALSDANEAQYHRWAFESAAKDHGIALKERQQLVFLIGYYLRTCHGVQSDLEALTNLQVLAEKLVEGATA